ncbi:hypothetical protein H1R20_g6800, partial [Candolleomyces eurysporus]
MLFNLASLVAVLYLNVFGTLALPVVEPRADGVDQTTYNNMERFARFSSAAYQLICPRPLGTTLIKSIDRSGTQGFVTRDDNRKEIVVSFRGTFSIGDAIVDLQVAMTDLNSPGVTGVGSSRVHTGFHFAYNAVANDVITAVRGQLSSRPSYTVVVTGHSLGGAVASLGALSLKSAFPSANVKLYTYGQPRVGNAAFASLVESRVGASNIYRVVHTYDGVPTVLFKALGYRHFATEYWQFKDPSKPANFRKCSGGDDPSCSDSIPSTFINPAHLIYFDQRGIPFPADFGPSITFAILYALLLPLTVYRMWGKRSRTWRIFGTITFSLERIVLFSFRAVQSRRDSWRFSNRLLKYSQGSWGVGYIGIASDLVQLLRCLLVNPTYGEERYDEAPTSRNQKSYFQVPEDGEQDRAEERARVRRFSDFLSLAFLSASIPAIIVGFRFNKDNFNSEEKADSVMKLRYASSAVALFLSLVIIAAAQWSRQKQARASVRTCQLLAVLVLLIAVVPIYRLSIMFHKTPALESQGPGSQSSPGAQAAFYIFHVVPEFLTTVTLLGLNKSRRSEELNRRQGKM